MVVIDIRGGGVVVWWNSWLLLLLLLHSQRFFSFAANGGMTKSKADTEKFSCGWAGDEVNRR
jgi:hypothetical protein